MESTISQESVSLLSQKIFTAAVTRLESLFIKLSEEISKETSLSGERIFELWNKISPDCQVDFNLAIKNEMKVKEQEEKKHKKREEEKDLPTCEYQYGPNATKANQLCGEPCKDKLASDGKNYCSRHLRQVDSKKRCVFVYGPKAINPGTECQARVAKKTEEFTLDGTYEGRTYKGCWMCQKHQKQVTKAISKKEKQCTYISGKNSKNPGTRCKSICKSGDLCTAHANTKKAKARTAEENKQNIRKELKKGSAVKDESDNESEIEMESDDEVSE